MSFAPEPRDIQGFLSGGVNTSPSSNQILATMVIAQPGQVRTVVICANSATLVRVAPNSPITVDLHINGVSTWTNPADRPTVPIGTPAFTPVAGRPNKRAVRPGDVLTLVVITSATNVGVAATAVIEYPD